ncbi:signal recognition particle protein [Methylomonas sp. MED-D]|uniref:Signal recognition particle protein n=1 Tax=Methylomonas koyamae TaxID=702114 RepID=A0A177N8P1_9GAMM|nr:MULTISPECIES: signal recognition particle protein [Methylomonas]NJA07100.1 signal recognition particle protein [Methylococcaceae bacterium WWC4]MDT4329712.1 signal recognition particle protein [Methylomonas sp. MV1]OAI14252.1 signal recognition particle protein [Methylomonas koyamae]OHX38359.1 signal recognition particle protein [Methylomonas sp. LWB]WGS87112.1 signal recognition particle protein [Methylomonas sp. UP202]
MFDNLSDRLSGALKKIKGQGRLTEANIQDTMREVRMALLEADVALPVVNDFIEQVTERALGQEVQTSLTPGQALIKVVQGELVRVMGSANEELNLRTNPPALILMAGLQGAGKTTTVAKLGRHLKEKKKKRVGVVSVDVYRPAAIKQLQTLADDLGLKFFDSESTEQPVDIVNRAIDAAKRQFLDVLIVDTAGRLHVDDEMMAEIKALHAAIKPIETLFVVDSMTGQDAANTAKAFHDALPLTGVILTKADGDARGGAALSIRHITGKPIKFIGVGEKSDALEPFYPDRLASRILGMGDVLSLIEDIEQNVDKKKAEQLAKKLQKGKSFDLEDLREQLTQMQNMGGIGAMMDKLPGMGAVPKEVKEKVNDKDLVHQIAVINSMTKQERRFPDLIKGSRKQRIADGCGLDLNAVNRVLKQHKMMEKMMKKFSKGNIVNMMRGLKSNMRGMKM